MSRAPLDQLEAGRAHYAERLPDIDGAHFGALWHLFTVGHLVTTDLDDVAQAFGCSFADLDFLGTLAVDDDGAMRATDLASTLYVSAAVTSSRIARLEARGWIVRKRSATDARAFELTLTPAGRELVEQAIVAMAREAKIVRFFGQLSPVDREALVRILGDLHRRFDREFVR